MEQLVTILVWPGVILIISIVFLFAFRGPISSLIDRTKKVSKGGLETFDVQQDQPTTEKKGIDEYLHNFDNPLVVEREATIRNHLKERKIEDHQEQIKVLIRELAICLTVQQIERIRNMIYKSQHACLTYVNTHNEGVSIEEVVSFYETAKAEYPVMYENQQLARWLNFLETFNLLTEHNSRVFITVLGREFLKYLISIGDSGPNYG